MFTEAIKYITHPERLGQALRLWLCCDLRREKDLMRHVRIHVARDDPKSLLRLQDRYMGVGDIVVRDDSRPGAV
jgi:hypothetical protein